MKALILTGGKSSRMGTDKASLKIGGITLLERLVALIKPLTDEIHLSVARDDSNPRDYPVIPDLELSPGPLGGLQAAFKNDPSADWLLVAVDLPRLHQEDLASLVKHHDPQKDVTCFLNPLDNHPEPLCALYSPSAATRLDTVIKENQRCARRFLASLNRIELTPSDPQALLNLNRPEHLVELELLHRHGPIEKEITVEYFARLSQEAGTTSEILRTSSATLSGLWEEVRLRHHFSLDLPHIKAAIDQEFADWTTPVAASQTIAFMPPFAGG